MKKHILFFAVAILSIVACDNKENRVYDEDGQIVYKGEASFANLHFDLTVDFNGGGEVSSSKAASSVSMDDFIIKVISKIGDKESVVNTWKKVDMPEKISLKVGSYRMEAIYPEKSINGAWEQPSYFGSVNFKIEDGKTTTISTLVCKPSNVKLSVDFKPLFTEQMSKYWAVITSGAAIVNYSSTEKRSAYFNPGSLIISIKGEMENGNEVFFVKRLDDCKAGDNIIIGVDATLSGEVIPSITIDVKTNDKNIDFVVDDDDIIIDPNPTDPDEPTEPDEPSKPKKPTVVGVEFDISLTMRHKEGQNAVVDVNITAEDGGIQALIINIDSPTLKPILDAQSIPSKFDLANLSAKDKKLFEEIGLIKAGDDVKNKKDFSFSIGGFMPLLPVGQHKFNVEVKDGSGVTTKAALVISVN